MTEETFGPTLPIMKVADAEEAVRLANDSPYGLGASVFTRDTERGEAIARRLEAGAANVNDAMINYTVLELPMGGAKASGSARATARAASASTAPSRRSWSRRGSRSRGNCTCIPYKRRTSRLLARVVQVALRPRQARLIGSAAGSSGTPSSRSSSGIVVWALGVVDGRHARAPRRA